MQDLRLFVFVRSDDDGLFVSSFHVSVRDKILFFGGAGSHLFFFPLAGIFFLTSSVLHVTLVDGDAVVVSLTPFRLSRNRLSLIAKRSSHCFLA